MKKYVDDFVDFGPGKQYYSSNSHIEYYKPLKHQADILREDMLQVGYGDDSLNYTIDVGWYGEGWLLKGCFRVFLVKNYDWYSPLLNIKCRSVKKLVPAIKRCLERVKNETDNFTLLPVHKESTLSPVEDET